jgi:hypothetical protein
VTSTARPARPGALLRFALRLDGVLIAASGIVIFLAAPQLSRLLLVDTATLYVIGAVSIAYLAITFGFAAIRPVGIGGVITITANLASAVAVVVDLAARARTLGAGGLPLEIVALGYCIAIAGLQLVGVLQLPSGRRLRSLPRSVG